MVFKNFRRSKIKKVLSGFRPKRVEEVKTPNTGNVVAEDIQKEEIKRLQVPTEARTAVTAKKDTLINLRKVRDQYPLHSVRINNSPIHLAHATVQYNPQVNQLGYFVTEPQLDKRLEKIAKRTVSELHDRLEIDFTELVGNVKLFGYIDKQVNEIWELLGVKLSAFDAIKVKYFVMRDAIGLNKIEPLMRDPNIEDISCDGVGLPLYIFHRNPSYGEMATNILFDNKDELDSFAMKLAQKCGRTISVSAPLMDGSLPDGSRVQITYGTDIARRGSNFTIRKFFRVPLTPVDLINFKTIDTMILAYLWLAIEKEKSILISGTTATGKTTILNALSLFIEPNLKIVSIEDTAELQLPHTNWMPQVTRSGFGSTGYGEVDMYALLKAALRQRPDYLIVGEVRGKEANVLFHAMSSGHAGLATIHADNIDAVVDRLTTRPIDLPASLLENLDIVIFLSKMKRDDKFIRRVNEVIEIEGYNADNRTLKTNKVFSWDPVNDKFTSNNSHVLYDVATHSGMDMNALHEELSRRVKVLEWMKNKGITRFNEVAKIINMYYVNSTQLSRMMGQRL
jgi:archaeal flagellar protein FlaI